MRHHDRPLVPLTGWGRTAPTVAAYRAATRLELPELVAGCGPRGALVRGLGRSYGDAAQNGGGAVLALVASVAGIRLDESIGRVVVPAGTTLEQLLRVVVPRGWFVPVTPGTTSVTIGGAIACDIHGKNHHADGSFGEHVRAMTVMLADGSIVELTPDRTPEPFWATVGGMGLTGAVLDATIDLLRIETSRISVDTDRAPDLDSVLAMMTEGDERYRYSVAWIDLVARGRSLGRSVLTRGDHAREHELDPAIGGARTYRPGVLVAVPPGIPRMLNHLTVAAFNELWFRRAPVRRRGEIQTISRFFHPLDGVRDWNRLYGRTGLVQYQFVVPLGEEDALRRVVEGISGSGAASFLAVLKRFGAGDPAPLGFPRPGWTLALDLPAIPEVATLLRDLDGIVLSAGGRHYLAKDAHMTRDAMRAGYPRLDEWRTVRDKLDPAGTWASDLGRRLGLVG